MYISFCMKFIIPFPICVSCLFYPKHFVTLKRPLTAGLVIQCGSEVSLGPGRCHWRVFPVLNLTSLSGDSDISRNLNIMMIKVKISNTISSFVDECCSEIMMHYYIIQCASISQIHGLKIFFFKCIWSVSWTSSHRCH